MGLRLCRGLSPAFLLACFPPPGLAQEIAANNLPPARIEPGLSESIAPALPEELKAESAIFLQRRLGGWTEADARKLLGEPTGRRDAYEQGMVTGDILAFRDPSRRYREFELLFDRRTRTLTAAFIYPWRMTWDECRRLWGDQVNTTAITNGNIFRSYLSRRLDVLSDANGRVINLGIY